jgi:tRNA threonylcarbamoyladenosine biosynthesis protein TsaB
MSLILSIDTSTEHASICLSENEKIAATIVNENQKEHASWLHPAIKDLLSGFGKSMRDLDVIGVTSGPGSYTGLRVGMATAKGLCYALQIPLITVNTLEAMASMALKEDADLICPMIDARRMEVFTAVYDKKLVPVLKPCSMILDKSAFSDLFENKKMIIFGNGSKKFLDIDPVLNADFKNFIFHADHLSRVIYNKNISFDFTPLPYAEPFYLKEFNFS